MQLVNSYIAMFLSFCMCAGFFGFLSEWGMWRVMGFFCVWLVSSIMLLLIMQFCYGVILFFEQANHHERHGEWKDDATSGPRNGDDIARDMNVLQEGIDSRIIEIEEINREMDALDQELRELENSPL